MNNIDTIFPKIESLKNWFEKHQRVVTALSGGVDSCLVAFLAREFLGRENGVAVISNSASLKKRDLEDAKSFCERYDIKLIITDAREIEDENYASNPVNRCYYCKSALYTELDRIVAQNFQGFNVINGNNFSDFGDYRPGIEAANENKVLSPLADCKMTKDDIRKMSEHYDLFVWNKPASPCLSSRFPYGEGITIEKLRMVEDAEELLYEAGFKDSRVRYFDQKAKIEVPADQLITLKNIITELKPEIIKLGFVDCEIDEEGLVSGKLNRVLNHG